MTTEAQVPEQETEKAKSTRSEFAVFFELEGIAANGRQGAFDILKSILKDEKVAFNAGHFSRYCLHPSPAKYADKLIEDLGIKKQAADKLAEDIHNGMVMHLTSGKTQLKAEFAALMDVIKARGFEIAALSSMPENVATQIAAKLELDRWNVQLFSTEGPIGDDVFPRADTWLKMARSLEKKPRKCLVIASNNAACKAALSAGMSCVAVPDSFTSFQDFGGADLVLDALDEASPDDILAAAFEAHQL